MRKVRNIGIEITKENRLLFEERLLRGAASFEEVVEVHLRRRFVRDTDEYRTCLGKQYLEPYCLEIILREVLARIVRYM